MTLIHVWFGGRFSPPTADQIRTTNAMIRALKHEHGQNAQIHIYFVPISKLHSKASTHESCVLEAHRLEMLGLEVAELVRKRVPGVHFHISDVDIRAPVAFKTIDSVQALMAEHGILNTIGADEHMYIALEQYSMEQLLDGAWFMAKDLINIFKYIVFPNDPAVALDAMRRKELLDDFIDRGHRIGAKHTEFIIVPGLGAGIDSALARKAIRERNWQTVNKYVIPSVAKYIREHNLFKSMACEGTQRGGSRLAKWRKTKRIKSTRKRR